VVFVDDCESEPHGLLVGRENCDGPTVKISVFDFRWGVLVWIGFRVPEFEKEEFRVISIKDCKSSVISKLDVFVHLTWELDDSIDFSTFHFSYMFWD
jgi:hypothetical protein